MLILLLTTANKLCDPSFTCYCFNMAARGKLPNLKICVDNTESTDESDVSVHDSGSYSSEDEDDRKFEESRKTVALRQHISPEDDVLSIGETEPTVRKFLSGGAQLGRKAQNYGVGEHSFALVFASLIPRLGLRSICRVLNSILISRPTSNTVTDLNLVKFVHLHIEHVHPFHTHV